MATCHVRQGGLAASSTASSCQRRGTCYQTSGPSSTFTSAFARPRMRTPRPSGAAARLGAGEIWLSCTSSQGLRGLRIGELRIRGFGFVISLVQTPSIPAFIGGFGLCANDSA
eukprot:2669435-Alexandrium_andersonii.AAC.1